MTFYAERFWVYHISDGLFNWVFLFGFFATFFWVSGVLDLDSCKSGIKLFLHTCFGHIKFNILLVYYQVCASRPLHIINTLCSVCQHTACFQVSYSKNELTWTVWVVDISLLFFGCIGFTTGTYAALVEICKTFKRLRWTQRNK